MFTDMRINIKKLDEFTKAMQPERVEVQFKPRSY